MEWNDQCRISASAPNRIRGEQRGGEHDPALGAGIQMQSHAPPREHAEKLSEVRTLLRAQVYSLDAASD